MYSMTQRALAEVLGTAALVLVGPGSVIATLVLAGKATPAVTEADLLGISFAFGFIITALVYAISRGGLSGWNDTLVISGFAIAAVGLVVVAVIPTDRGVAATTTSGLIHNLTGLVSFLAVVISEVGLSRAMRHNTRLAAYANGFSRLALLATATFVLVFLAAGPFVSVGVFGLAQRLFLACALLWIFLASLRLRAISMPAHADTTGIVRV